MRILAIVIFLVLGVTSFGDRATANPIEVGNVNWGRDFDAALQQSGETEKPVLVLFQEVPG